MANLCFRYIPVMCAQPSLRRECPPTGRAGPGNGKNLLGRLVFLTGNCDATFEHIEAAGAEMIQEPIAQPGGVRDWPVVSMT